MKARQLRVGAWEIRVFPLTTRRRWGREHHRMHANGRRWALGRWMIVAWRNRIVP